MITFSSSFLHSCFLLQERILKCIKLIRDLELTGGSTKGAPVASVPQSPKRVLEASCLSYRSDETTFGSCADSSDNNVPPTKRPRIDR